MDHTRARKPGETVFCCLMVMLSAFLLWTAFGISELKSYTSAGAFPMAAAATMLVCSVMVLVKTIKLAPVQREDGQSVWAHFVRSIVPPVVLWISLAIVGYMLLLEALGFIVSSFAFLLISMRLLSEPRWVRNALLSALSLAAIHLVFQTAFSVVLPAGRLWQGFLR